MTNRLTLTFAALLAGAIAAGCSGGDSSKDAADPRLPASNHAPTISGTPPLSVTRDQGYAFTPAASDPDGDTLTFSIVNQPGWATFNPATGALTGMPGDVDIGTTSGVIISVSDGELSASLSAFNIEVLQVVLGSALVSWDLPTTNADGSPMDDLAGFEVHYGSAPGDYSALVTISDPLVDSAQIDELSAGSWYFAVRAFDVTGNRSGFSVEVTKDVQP